MVLLVLLLQPMLAAPVTNLTFSDQPATTANCIVTQIRIFTAIDDLW